MTRSVVANARKRNKTYFTSLLAVHPTTSATSERNIQRSCTGYPDLIIPHAIEDGALPMTAVADHQGRPPMLTYPVVSGSFGYRVWSFPDDKSNNRFHKQNKNSTNGSFNNTANKVCSSRMTSPTTCSRNRTTTTSTAASRTSQASRHTYETVRAGPPNEYKAF